MTAREYLEQVHMQDRKVRLMRTKLKMLREALDIKGVSYECNGVKNSSHPTDQIAEAICKIVDYENEVKEEEAKLTILRFNAEKAIASLEDENEQEVLERWYLLFQPLETIMKEMSYSESRVYAFRRAGLKKLKLPEEQQQITVNSSK